MQKVWFFVISLAAVFSCQSKELTVRYPAKSHPYVIELLTHALAKQQLQFQLTPVEGIPTQSRALRLLGQQDGLDVFWTVTSAAREKLANAVYIPIVKGMLGYRIPLVHQKNQHIFSKIYYPADMRNIVFGLREDWPDSDVFINNELSTFIFAKGADPQHMLVSMRVDALPQELSALTQSFSEELIFDENIVIYYPNPVYFFVSNENTWLHQQLQSGLKKLIADGTFETLFIKHFGDVIQQANLPKRRIIKMTNPGLPNTAPLKDASFWLQSN